MTQHTEPAAHEIAPAHSAYHHGLPIGQRVSAAPLLESPFFGFEGDLRLARLEPMFVPKKPREGKHDAAELDRHDVSSGRFYGRVMSRVDLDSTDV